MEMKKGCGIVENLWKFQENGKNCTFWEEKNDQLIDIFIFEGNAFLKSCKIILSKENKRFKKYFFAIDIFLTAVLISPSKI